jgi:hypothetical protein
MFERNMNSTRVTLSIAAGAVLGLVFFGGYALGQRSVPMETTATATCCCGNLT